MNESETASQSLQSKIDQAKHNPENIGELPGADSVGTVGNPECGEMMRLWIKYRDDKGRRVIDRATFQSFGCETAIAVAALATQMLKGKTRDEALSLGASDIAGGLGPLPPMKIHCAELVQSAMRAALAPGAEGAASNTAAKAGPAPMETLADSLKPAAGAGAAKIRFLK